MSLGSELKEAREAQGLSLDTLQEKTKIQKRYLEAIENENFHILPGTFYARAFIKEYANAVGLDPNELMEAYQDEIPTTEDEGTVQYTPIERSRREQPGQKSLKIFSVLPTIIVVLLVIGIIFFAWYLNQQSAGEDNDTVNNNSDNNDELIQNSNDENNQNDDNNDENSDASNNNENEDNDNNDNNDNNNDDDEAEPEFSVVEEGSGNSPESEMDFTHEDDEVTLELDASDDAWIELTDESGESIYSSNLTEDDSPEEFDITDEKEVSLNVGSANHVTITINDVEMEYPVDEEIVHQKIQINLIDDSE